MEKLRSLLPLLAKTKVEDGLLVLFDHLRQHVGTTVLSDDQTVIFIKRL
ncbi:MAG: hypothetical protein N2450_02745 [bacterium]|nr:hypothetical protein [bacterium]